MATLQSAKEKWATSMANVGPRWKQAAQAGTAEYGSGMARFLGVGAIRPDRIAAHRAGIEAVSAAEFQAAVAGKEEKWARKFVAAMT